MAQFVSFVSDRGIRKHAVSLPGIGKHGLHQLRVMRGCGGQRGGCAVSVAQHGTERPKGCALFFVWFEGDLNENAIVVT